MKHIHGIEVRLTDSHDEPISEAAPHKRTAESLLRFNGQVGSRNICLPAGDAFKLHLKFHREFKIYKAEGVKVVVVANGVLPDDKDGKVRQRRGLWWIGVDVDAVTRPTLAGSEYVIDAFPIGRRRSVENVKGMQKALLMPKVDSDYKAAKTNWVTQEYYCANRGCVAVFVERGKLVQGFKNGRKTSAGSLRAQSFRVSAPIPIKYDEFVALNSPNANPYVFEFRNLEPSAIDPRALNGKDVAFGDEPSLVISDAETAYDTASDSTSEEEAEATDSNGSGVDFDSDSGSEFAVSEDSDEVPPAPLSRKRKPPRPQNFSSRKRQRTAFEKNIDADTMNTMFPNQAKHARADATNGSLASCHRDYDRDDDEIPHPALKRESIKPEHPESSTCAVRPQGSSTKKASSRRSLSQSETFGGRRTKVIDLTMDDSADETQGYEKIATFRAFRKLSGLGGGKLIGKENSRPG